MAHHMIYEITTDANQDTVMTALTTEDGITSWWTERAEITGDQVLPYFPGSPAPFALTVTEQTASRLVWKAGDFPPPWRGTHCVWDVSPNPDGAGTKIDFSHRNWPEDNPVIGKVTPEWARILDHLQRYLNTGVSDPRTPLGRYSDPAD